MLIEDSVNEIDVTGYGQERNMFMGKRLKKKKKQKASTGKNAYLNYLNPPY